ncbi:hypothetical protein [Alteribacillus sp. YIM 98480]|uniref:hypothetical protein n=1 Tax=Alteribacillus sp. YIM 98480 TaxID=2606599 RepID=UPI00131C3A11|nr:hypothetical protein [Alteribacillus sp. YIM 98480]
MAGYFKNVMEKTKITFQQVSILVKEKLYDITGTSTVTVEQLAEYIQTHPERKKTNKTFLGMSFTFYRLNEDGIHYYLEMRDSYILQMDVYTSDHQIVSYRSYRDQHDITAPLKFP